MRLLIKLYFHLSILLVVNEPASMNLTQEAHLLFKWLDIKVVALILNVWKKDSISIGVYFS